VPGGYVVRDANGQTLACTLDNMLPEVRKRIPPSLMAELSNQHLTQEQAGKLNLKPGDVRCI